MRTHTKGPESSEAQYDSVTPLLEVYRNPSSPPIQLSIMNVTLSDYIYVVDDVLTENFCKHVIKKFEKDDRKNPGMIGDEEYKRVDKSIKDSMDLQISELDNWKDEDEVLFKALNKHIKLYLDQTDFLNDPHGICFEELTDTGYQIQRTTPSAGYTWHHDSMQGEYVRLYGMRHSTFIWYLNDIKKGGYTEFVDSTKVQPKTGRMCIFPSLWNYYHRGYPPLDETKYIVTGWLHA